ncbi:hypothetical protein AVEN_7297-1 [Araneus ventricosus]|uniref:Uncharacterized protein n=1 Tax=Araneus ventricosus TaxID=182803 RepID=A0A4Y2TYC6_ARAVE|nr:hypothetical protein AVEN_7297-1 [Araneus ventricosus]
MLKRFHNSIPEDRREEMDREIKAVLGNKKGSSEDDLPLRFKPGEYSCFTLLTSTFEDVNSTSSLEIHFLSSPSKDADFPFLLCFKHLPSFPVVQRSRTTTHVIYHNKG